MPDSAVNPARPDVSAASADDRTASAHAPVDSDTKLARATRPVQRSVSNGRAPYGAPTFDLFAEDTERATLQALNTDIRQSTLPGFELPEVFMAAVEAVSAIADAEEHLASIRWTRREVLHDDATNCAQPENPAANRELPLVPADDPDVGSRKSSSDGV